MKRSAIFFFDTSHLGIVIESIHTHTCIPTLHTLTALTLQYAYKQLYNCTQRRRCVLLEIARMLRKLHRRRTRHIGFLKRGCSCSLRLCSTDTDMRIGIGPIRIRRYVIFLKNSIRGYVLVIFYKININAY